MFLNIPIKIFLVKMKFWGFEANTASPSCELAGREEEGSINTWISPAECNPLIYKSLIS